MRRNNLIALIVILISCSSEDNNAVLKFRNDMDMQVVWSGPSSNNLIQDYNAYSGLYVCRLDSANPLSPCFAQSKRLISNHQLSKAEIRCHIKFLDGKSRPEIVMEIYDSSWSLSETLTKSIDCGINHPKGWFRHEFIIDLNKNNRNDALKNYKIYVINRSTSEILVDDMEILFYK